MKKLFGGVSISSSCLSFLPPLTVDFKLTIAALPYRLPSSPVGPWKLLFRSLVQQIHADAPHRRDLREGRLSKHIHPEMAADLEAINFFVNREQVNECIFEIVPLFSVHTNSKVFK